FVRSSTFVKCGLCKRVVSYLTHCCHVSSSFFFSMPRRPPGSPLFPYTTLFRSGGCDHVDPCIGRLSGEDRGDEQLERALAARRQDRKSTRLNSSHEWISYAVFCLKKKKNKKFRTENTS